MVRARIYFRYCPLREGTICTLRDSNGEAHEVSFRSPLDDLPKALWRDRCVKKAKEIQAGIDSKSAAVVT